jgi:hypothetical protein
MQTKRQLNLLVIFVVTWNAVMHRPVRCKSKTESACYENVIKKHERRFATKPQAMEFIQSCPKDVCSGWVLNEVHE